MLRALPVLLLFYFGCTGPVFGQCLEKNFSFQENEFLEYEAYYNWGFIWLNAGWVSFKVNPGTYNNRPIYYFDSKGGSHPNYDWIFKVRDRYQCYFDKETLLPLWFYRQNSEGGFEVDNKYFFDHPNNKVISYTENSDRPFSKDTVSIPDCTYDVLSLIYYCRNLDFSSMRVGDSLTMKSILDREVFELYIRYLGKEEVETREGKRYNCIKFSALLIEGTIFEGGEDLYVWVTDDLNRVPVLVEAKILIGSVKAYLTRMEGLRNPVTSLVK